VAAAQVVGQCGLVGEGLLEEPDGGIGRLGLPVPELGQLGVEFKKMASLLASTAAADFPWNRKAIPRP
jgi:hypothetical protein